MRFTRVYADEAGESHFDEIPVALAPVEFAPPAPAFDVSAPLEAARMMFAELPPGWCGEPHPVPRPHFYLPVSGELEIGTSDGEIRLLGPGSIALFEDTTGKGHTTRVVSGRAATGVFVQRPW